MSKSGTSVTYAVDPTVLFDFDRYERIQVKLNGKTWTFSIEQAGQLLDLATEMMLKHPK